MTPRRLGKTRRSISTAHPMLTLTTLATLAVLPGCTSFSGIDLSEVDGAARGPGDLDASVALDGSPLRADAQGDLADAVDARFAPVGQAFLTVADAARACARASDCPLLTASVIQSLALPLDPTSFSACVDILAAPLPPRRNGVANQAQFLRCIADADSCASAGACLPIEIIDVPSDPRCAPATIDGGHGGGPAPGDAAGAGDPPDAAVGERCSATNDAVINCDQGAILHCGTTYYPPGSRCIRGDDGTHWCSLPVVCPPQPACQGSYNLYCGGDDHTWGGFDCAASGWTCGTSPSTGAPTCLSDYDIKACATPEVTCVDTQVAICDGTQQSLIDCAPLGGTCVTAPRPHCVRPGDACTSFDANINTCTKSAISLCVGGAPVQFDCDSVGLACVAGNATRSGGCRVP